MKEIVCNAMCLKLSTFDLGKYIFENQHEADTIDSILQSHHQEQAIAVGVANNFQKNT